MIYLTGDTHGRAARLSRESMPFAESWGKGDTLIVCGDFGFLMNGTKREEMFLRELSFRPYTICFLDGNRENFTLLDALKVSEWRGGKVHRLRHNVIHLMRGQVYTIDGKKIFTMGGGCSIDRERRYEGVDWWPQEMPSEAEYAEATQNLAANGNSVDYVLTHAAPQTVMDQIYLPNPEEKPLNDYLDWVLRNVAYKRWYFGHLHVDAALDNNIYALFMSVRELDTGKTVW